MRARTILPALAAALLAAGTTPPRAPVIAVPGPIWFEGSVKRALAEAGRRRTLVFLDFSPDW